MAFSEALRLVIDADTRGAVQGIEKLGATADRELGRSQSSLDKWGNKLTSLGTGMIAFGGAALVGLGAMAKASEDANLAQVKLQNTIDNMPKLAGATASEFTDLADSIQDVTAADADAIVEAEALLGTFNLTAKEIKGITPLVVDYARKFGVDMADAAVQVGKALDGQVGALKRNGVSIDEALFATDRYTAVQKALSEQVGGFAEAEGKTFAGSLERMKNELGDLAEGVGGGAVDAFTTMFGAVDKLTGALQSVSPEAQNTIGKVATFGAVGLVAAGGISTLIGQVIQARKNFALAAESIVAMRASLVTLGQIGLVVGSLVALREVLGTIDDEVDRVDLSKLENQLLDLSETGKVSGETLERVFAGISDSGLGGGIEDVRQMKSDIDQLDDALAKLSARDPEAAAAAFERITEALRDQGVPADLIKDRFDNYNAALAESDTANRTTGAAVDEATGALDDQAESTENATTKLEEYSNTLRAQFDPLFATVSASRSLADANADVAAKEIAVAVAKRDHGEASMEAFVAQEELNRAYDDASQAALDQELALTALVDMVRQQPGALDSAKAKLQQWVDQGLITQATADATAAKFDEVTGAANQIPAVKNTVITAFDQASGVIRVIQERVDALTGKTIYLNAIASYPVPGYQTFGGRQAGGGVVPDYFQSGGVNWNWGKGPRGSDTVPAWLTPGEMILNQHQQSSLFRLLNAGGGGGGGGVIELHSHLYMDGKEVVESVKRYERTNGTSWRN